ncbi:hypothetical protein [Novosphingobium sp.]|uniref:hypothetical protein n=1 Tax=Novosphingobium sp. TaxID=1874826 RepID=UPI0025F9DFB3|nr:hypothetical protein [Novosphingobium sp.]
MRMRALTTLAASIGLAALCAPICAVADVGLAATTHLALCPTDPAAALNAFASPLPNLPDALALLGCSDPVTRVRAIAALGDAEAPSADAIAAIIAHLSDPAEIIRQEALVATLRNADAMRPALLARMAADSLDTPTSGADWAAAALKVIGRGGASGGPVLLPGGSRWQALFEQGIYLPGAAPATKGPGSLLSPDTAARSGALPVRCHRNAATGKWPDIRLCRAGSRGATAYAAIVAAEDGLAEKTKAFEQAAVFALTMTAQRQAHREPLMSADQITCELTAVCDETDFAKDRAYRESSRWQ